MNHFHRNNIAVSNRFVEKIFMGIWQPKIDYHFGFFVKKSNQLLGSYVTWVYASENKKKKCILKRIIQMELMPCSYIHANCWTKRRKNCLLILEACVALSIDDWGFFFSISLSLIGCQDVWYEWPKFHVSPFSPKKK